MVEYRLIHMARVLGVSLSVTMGCSWRVREERMREDLTDSFCDQPADLGFLYDLRPVEPADALVLRTWINNKLSINEIVGNCDDIPACPEQPPAESREALDLGGNFEGEPQHVVAYRGDQVTTYYTEEELRAFLGTIDTLGEARLLLVLAGYWVPCDFDHTFKIDGADYVFYAWTGHGCKGSNRWKGHIVRVHPGGQLVVERSTNLKYGC